MPMSPTEKIENWNHRYRTTARRNFPTRDLQPMGQRESMF
jgi:hypothetical protein